MESSARGTLFPIKPTSTVFKCVCVCVLPVSTCASHEGKESGRAIKIATSVVVDVATEKEEDEGEGEKLRH